MKCLCICGATATGKTSLAVECAERLKTEIISGDSQLVYKGLDIGTAKPTKEEMRSIKHHVIDVVSPEMSFSVSDYEKLAAPIVDNLANSGKVPIICGGTGFYINSLLFNLSYGKVPANPQIREKYEKAAQENGKEYVYELLKKVDPESAKVLHPNDIKRVIRALEIYEAGGTKKSEINDGLKIKREYVAVAVNYDREELYKRIDARVDRMFDCGLVEEVKNLLSRGIGEKNQCMQAIGYKEVVAGLKNNCLQSTMRDIIKQNTRHYAKRQLTFFKKLPNIVWINSKEAGADKILEIYNDGR